MSIDIKNFTEFWDKLSSSSGINLQNLLNILFRDLSEKLNLPIKDIKFRAQYSVCHFDMSQLRIEVGEETPFYFIQSSHIKIDEIFYQIKTSLYQKNLQENISFICTDKYNDQLRELVKTSYLDVVVLARSDIYKIFSSEDHRRALLKLILEQHGVSVISPYSHTRIPTGAMFYGRKEEIQRVVRSNFDINFAVIGSRRIGKSSLIMNLKKTLDRDSYYYTIFFDCYSIDSINNFIQQIVTKIDVRSFGRISRTSFHEVMKQIKITKNKKIVLILDEIDDLLEVDKNSDWQLSKIFHTLASEEICKIIIAGYRKLYKEINNQHSPLFKYYEPIYLKELDDFSAKKLVLEPLDDIGINIINRNEFAEKITTLTANHPQFIQFICGKLIDVANKKNSRELDINDIGMVEKLDEYYHFVIDTLIINTDQFQQLIVYEMTKYDTFSIRHIIKVLESQHKIDLSLTSIQRDCNELELANIFKRVNGNYTFAYPALPNILKDHYDLEYRKKRLAEEILSERKYYAR